MNWISKQNAQRKVNLLKYNPVVDHASKGPEQRGKNLQKKILNLSDKHAGLYSSVIEGEGQNKYTSGDYDKDYEKLGKVEDKLSKKEKKYKEKFNKSPYAPNMEGPLNKDRLSKTIDKAEDAYDEGNYKKAFRKGKSVARQAVRKGLKTKEEGKAFKENMRSNLGLSMKGPLNREGWIQEATASIKKRGTEGVCTGDKFGSASCPPGSKRYNLA